MKLEYKKYIKREDLRKNPKKVYLFGDNIAQRGFGGQAKEMRGEPNAYGIPTKIEPANTINSFFRDEYFPQIKPYIDKAFERIPRTAKAVVIPIDGLGTGRARLPKYAPKIFEYIALKIKELENE